jgi:hypothetical protein
MDSIKGHGRLRIARFEEARRALQWYCYTLLFGMRAALEFKPGAILTADPQSLIHKEVAQPLLFFLSPTSLRHKELPQLVPLNGASGRFPKFNAPDRALVCPTNRVSVWWQSGA